MQLQQAIKNVFVQLSESLEQLRPEQYKQPSEILFNATIGQHVRHIIELFQCLNNGYETGMVNYEKRKRDYRIETDKDLAVELLNIIFGDIDKADKDLILEAGYDDHSNDLL